MTCETKLRGELTFQLNFTWSAGNVHVDSTVSFTKRLLSPNRSAYTDMLHDDERVGNHLMLASINYSMK